MALGKSRGTRSGWRIKQDTILTHLLCDDATSDILENSRHPCPTQILPDTNLKGFSMAKFSANLGFLWTELSLPEAIKKAVQSGFDAVECHWPYDYPATEIATLIEQQQVPMLGLNTIRGNVDQGDFGLAAVAGREQEAQENIKQAIDYAAASNTQNVHIMAGKITDIDTATRVFTSNLEYALTLAKPVGVKILIEPINHRDAPGYFLNTIEQARHIIDAIGDDSIRIMFDCYHTQISQGDLIKRLQANSDYIGHIQIASNPDRTEPDQGEVHYPSVIEAIDKLGYNGYIGAEYKPATTTDAGLGWLKQYKSG